MTLIKKEVAETVSRENNNYVELYFDTDLDMVCYRDRDGIATPAPVGQGGGSDYTETIVNISSAQIANSGVTPVNILGASGIGKIYDYDYVLVEYTATGNELASPAFKLTDGASTICTFYPIGVTNSSNVIKTFYLYVDTTNFVVSDLQRYENLDVTFTTLSGVNPDASVDGTMRVKIYHKTITFGA